MTSSQTDSMNGEDRLSGGAIFSFMILAAWIGLFVSDYFLANTTRDFWDLDISLFWRFAENPDLFAKTSPILNAVFSKHPGVTIDFFKWLISHGITQQVGYGWLYVILVVLATTFVSFGLYQILRALGLDRPKTVLGVIIITSSPLFVSYSRLHPLKTVMTHGGASMFALSISIVALGLFLRGFFYSAGFIAVCVTMVHAVTGPLISASVFLGSVFSRRKEKIRNNILYFAGMALMMAVVAFPFLLDLFSVIGSEVKIDPDVFFGFVNARSSNPMPLKDGIDHVFTHLAVFFSLLVLVKYVNGRTGVAERIRWAGYFWLICYLLQIIFSEIMRSPELTRLALNRISPSLFFLFAGVAAFHVIGFYEKRSYFASLSILLIVLFTSQHFRWLSTLHTYNYGLAALLVALIVHLCHCRQETYRWIRNGFYLFLALFVLIACGRWLVGVGFNLHLKILRTFLIFSGFVISWTLMKNLLAWLNPKAIHLRARLLSLRWNGMYIMLVAALVIKSAIILCNIEKLSRPNVPAFRLYSRLDITDIIRNGTAEDETIFSTVTIDLNGIRRQYIDWKYEWYSLYQPGMIPDIINRMKLIGIDIDHDEKAEKYCGKFKWLYRERCYSDLLDVDKRMSSFPWREKKDILRKIDPKIVAVLIRKQDIQKDDQIIGRNESFALVKLE